MPPVTAYGTSYLDTDSFRASAAMYGVGMALCDYPDTDEGNKKLGFVLQSASRMIETFCASDFVPADKTEQQPLDLTTWRFKVNNPPVLEVVSCAIRIAHEGAVAIQPAKVYINNQQGYCEICRSPEVPFTITGIGTELQHPIVEIVYKSRQSIPVNVQLACGFQAGHLINSGYVDKTLPPNFGKVDMDGLSINNKKGYKTPEEINVICPEARQLLAPEKKISIA